MQHSGTGAQRAQHYREEAAKLRKMAETAQNTKTAAQFIDLAEQYELMAERLLRGTQI